MNFVRKVAIRKWNVDFSRCAAYKDRRPNGVAKKLFVLIFLTHCHTSRLRRVSLCVVPSEWQLMMATAAALSHPNIRTKAKKIIKWRTNWKIIGFAARPSHLEVEIDFYLYFVISSVFSLAFGPFTVPWFGIFNSKFALIFSEGKRNQKRFFFCFFIPK